LNVHETFLLEKGSIDSKSKSKDLLLIISKAQIGMVLCKENVVYSEQSSSDGMTRSVYSIFFPNL